MRIGGTWVGWGLGDWSHNPDGTDRDPTVRNVKAFMRKKFPSYAGVLVDNNRFDQQMHDILWEMQRRYHEGGRLHAPNGILDLDTQVVMGYKKPPPAQLPVIFTVEGHLSDMWAGPCAFTAQILEQQGVCKWQPVGYDCVSLPFKNQTGIDELKRLLNDKVLLPPGTPWGMCIFSQGAIVGCRFFMDEVRNPQGPLHWRYPDLRRVAAFGNPYREKDHIASYIPDPPRPGTQGISDRLMTETPDYWMEIARHGDLYAENTTDEVGLNKTAIYKIAAESSWTGGKAGMFTRILDAITNPVDGIWDITRAIISGIMFAGNMAPHGMYDLGPVIEHMRGVKA